MQTATVHISQLDRTSLERLSIANEQGWARRQD